MAVVTTLLVIAALVLLLPRMRDTSTKHRTLMMLVTGALALRYIAWRVTQTLEPFRWEGERIYQAWFFFVDLYLVLFWLDFFWGLRRLKLRKPADARAAEQRSDWPAVDVLVPTYNESLRVIEKTIIAARRLDYPNVRVWVLDDGDRDWLRDQAEAWQVRYLRRPEHDHAKAGNLNHAIQHIARHHELPEFFLILDADFVVLPELLKRVVPLADDPDVAVVQTPQCFYNPDPFQFAFRVRSGWPDTQRMLFEADLPARDASNFASCCGTSFIVRARDLLELGCFPHDSLSEDTLMSMRLLARGKRTVYLNEPLSFGLAAEGLNEHLNQQARWCLGWTQIGHTEFGPFTDQRRSFSDRLGQLNSFISWGFASFLRVALLLTPTLHWFFEWKPLTATSDQFITYFVPMWVMLSVTRFKLSNGTDIPIVSDAIATIASPVVVAATLRGLGKNRAHAFKVTDKGLGRDRSRAYWPLLALFGAIAAVNLIGMLYATFSPYRPLTTFGVWAYFWTVYNLLVLHIAAHSCLEPAQRRAEQRFITDEGATVTIAGRRQRLQLLDLSVSGAALSCARRMEPGSRLTLQLDGVGQLEARVVGATGGRLRLAFADDAELRSLLVAKLFTPKYIQVARSADLGTMARAVWRSAYA